MARCKNSPDTLKAKSELADRLREIRTERFGERGGPELSRRLGLPVRTWYNYEVGVTVPGEILLRFVELTAVEPMWLLNGIGPKYRASHASNHSLDSSDDSAVGLLRRALSLLHEDRSSSGVDLPFERSVWRSYLDDAENGEEAESSDTLLLRVRPDDGSERVPDDVNYLRVKRDWLDSMPECRCIRHHGDAMEPTLGDGAFVAFAARPEPPEELDGSLVVFRHEGRLLVRWLQLAGRYALLRAENPARDAIVPIDLEATSAEARPFRRVLWACSAHGQMSTSPLAATGESG